MATLEELQAEKARRTRLRELEAERERRRQAAGPTLRAPEAAAPIDVPLPGAAAVAAGAAALAFGWFTARRTLLAARPHLTRRWFGVFGPAVWRCGRCGTEIKLRTCRCKVCGQEQTWPKWTRVPYYSVERQPPR